MPKLTDEHFPTLQKGSSGSPGGSIATSPKPTSLKQVDVADLAAEPPGSPQASVLLVRWYNPAQHGRGQRPRRFPSNNASYKLEVLGISAPLGLLSRLQVAMPLPLRHEYAALPQMLGAYVCLTKRASGLSALRRADAIRCRLGGTAHEIDPAFPPKPFAHALAYL